MLNIEFHKASYSTKRLSPQNCTHYQSHAVFRYTLSGWHNASRLIEVDKKETDKAPTVSAHEYSEAAAPSKENVGSARL